MQDESFLEDVNMMLNTGDIPNLYEKEERLEIIEKVSMLHQQDLIEVLYFMYCMVSLQFWIFLW